MVSTTYFKSAISHWFLYSNPALRHLYMRWIRRPYILHMAAKERGQ